MRGFKSPRNSAMDTLYTEKVTANFVMDTFYTAKVTVNSVMDTSYTAKVTYNSVMDTSLHRKGHRKFRDGHALSKIIPGAN
jgi:hypothetical protein